MKILIVNNGIIPALKYGGTERVIWCLAKELTKMGHQISFLVKKGSYCDFAKVIEINPQKTISSQIPNDIDFIHFNSVSPEGVEKPHVVTIHGNRLTDSVNINTIFVSKNHAQRFGSNSFVYNGLDWDDYGTIRLNIPRNGYHFLGKAAWKVKNVKGAIEIVKALSGEYLEVLGGYRFNFKMGIRFTFSPKIHFEGMVDNIQKKKILEQSKGLLFPVVWNEPFGLAITESLYFGTPVFGTPYGSLPELVTKEVGFLSDSQSSIIRHLKEDYDYLPRVCHEYARDLFNSKIMAEEYMKKYEFVLNGQTLNTVLPHAIVDDRRIIFQE